MTLSPIDYSKDLSKLSYILCWVEKRNIQRKKETKSQLIIRYKLKFLIKHCFFYWGGDQLPVFWSEWVGSALGAPLDLKLVFVDHQHLKELTGINVSLIVSLGALY